MHSESSLSRFPFRIAVAALALAPLCAFGQAAPPTSGKTPEGPRPASAGLPPGSSAPAPAGPAEVPAFEVAQIAPQAWVGRFGPSNCAWLDLGDGVLVIDTGASKADAERLISQIAKTTNGKAVKWIVLTHLHGHANSGLPSFLPTGATIFVHPAVASGVAEKLAAAAPGSAKANVVGVAKPQTVGSGKNRVEISSPGARAATGQDLWAFLPDSALAFVGDLVVPGRCPNMTDPEADPDAWIRTLAEIAGRKPNILAGSGGDVSHQAVEDLETTKSYVSRIVGTAREFKAKGYPESRLPAELNLLKKVGDYCPTTIDLPNGQAIFRRMGSDGTVKPMRRP